jgi:di/tricarboxylate transporter
MVFGLLIMLIGGFILLWGLQNFGVLKSLAGGSQNA